MPRNLSMTLHIIRVSEGQRPDSIPAQGNALGYRSQKDQSPEGAAQSWDAPSGLSFLYRQTQGVALGWHGSHRWCLMAVAHSTRVIFSQAVSLSIVLRSLGPVENQNT